MDIQNVGNISNNTFVSNVKSITSATNSDYDLDGDGKISDSEYSIAETTIYNLISTSSNSLFEGFVQQIKSFGNTPAIKSWEELDSQLKNIIKDFETGLSNSNLTITQRYKGLTSIVNVLSSTKSNICAKLSKNMNACGTEIGKEALKVSKELYTKGFDKYINEYKSILKELDFKGQDKAESKVTNYLADILNISKSPDVNLNYISEVFVKVDKYLSYINNSKRESFYSEEERQTNFKKKTALSSLNDSADAMTKIVNDLTYRINQLKQSGDNDSELITKINKIKSSLDRECAAEIKKLLTAIDTDKVNNESYESISAIFNKIDTSILENIDKVFGTSYKADFDKINENISKINYTPVQESEINISDYMSKEEIQKIINVLVKSRDSIMGKVSSELASQYKDEFQVIIDKYSLEAEKATSEPAEPELNETLKTALTNFNNSPNDDNFKSLKAQIATLFGNKTTEYLKEVDLDKRKAKCKELEQLYKFDELLTKFSELPASTPDNKKSDIYNLYKIYFTSIMSEDKNVRENANEQKLNIVQSILECKSQEEANIAAAKAELENKRQEFLSLSDENNTVEKRTEIINQFIDKVKISFLLPTDKETYLTAIYSHLVSLQQIQLNSCTADEDSEEYQNLTKSLLKESEELKVKISKLTDISFSTGK
ncbi:hypothetical protein IJ182_11425 [bacterium]|nr:hypothetical protein [bacterium]